MKKILILITMMAVSSCAASKKAEAPKEPAEKKYFLARVTFYTDCPIYGKKTASTKIASQGTTVAAAKKIPFGTKFRIPRLAEWIKTDGIFRVDDRGPAVDRMAASGGKMPVIDVYVSSKAKVKELGGKSENIFKVYKQ